MTVTGSSLRRSTRRFAARLSTPLAKKPMLQGINRKPQNKIDVFSLLLIKHLLIKRSCLLRYMWRKKSIPKNFFEERVESFSGNSILIEFEKMCWSLNIDASHSRVYHRKTDNVSLLVFSLKV